MLQVRRFNGLVLAGVAGLGLVVSSLAAAPKDAPSAASKMSIEEVMEKGFKGKEKSLFSQVTAGKATAEQRKQLIALCEAMCNETPSKGDAAEWKKKTGALLAAAKAAEGGDAKALAALKQAGNCKACHDVHKE